MIDIIMGREDREPSPVFITGTIFPALGAGGGKLAELAFKGMGGAVNEIAKGISSTISNISAALLQFTAEQMIGTMI